MSGISATTNVSWTGTGGTGNATLTAGSSVTIPAGATVTFTLATQTGVSVWSVAFWSDNQTLNGQLLQGLANQSLSVTIPVSGALTRVAVQVAGTNGGEATITSLITSVVTATVSIGQATVTLSNGANHNVATSGQGTLRIAGPTAAFSVGGLAPGSGGWSGGQTVTIVNTTTQAMTILNADSGSTSTNQIVTQTGGPVTLLPGLHSSATFIYDGTNNNLVLQNVGLHNPISYNVKDFGAAGDGVTDDTAAINSAIATANNYSKVVFPPGTYIIASNITAANTTSVHLEGTSTRYGGVLLEFSASGSTTMLDATGSSKFRLSNMRLISTNSGFTGKLVDLSGSNQGNFEDVGFSGAPGNTTSNLVTVTNTYGHSFKSCTFDYAAVGVYGIPDNGHFANGIRFVSCGNGAATIANHVVVNPSAGWIFDGCTFEALVGGGASAIYCDGGAQVLGLSVRGCWFGDNTSSSTAWLHLLGDGINVSGNMFTGSVVGGSAIDVGGIGISITGNVFQVTTAPVNFVSQCQNVEYQGNAIVQAAASPYTGTVPYNATLQAAANANAFAVGAGTQTIGPYKMRAHQFTGQANVLNATWTKMTFDTTDFDVNSNWDGSGLYTVPLTGYYFVTGCVGYAFANGGAWISIYKNNVATNQSAGAFIHAVNGEATTVATTVTDIVHCNVSDTISLYTFQDSGASANTAGNGLGRLTISYMSS